MFYFIFIFVDIDECTGGENFCNVNALCSNTAGSYVCRCIRGFEGDGRTCVGTFYLHHVYRVALKMLLVCVVLGISIFVLKSYVKVNKSCFHIYASAYPASDASYTCKFLFLRFPRRL